MVRSIAIGGFMGVGKTTAGKALAHRLGMPFVDLDDAVEERAGMSVARVFKAQGEHAFRRLETETLADVLSGSPAVLALGGGTLHNPPNLVQLSDAVVVCLVMELEGIRGRLGSSDTGRPLWADAEELYDQRQDLYRSMKHVLNVDELSTEIVVDRIEEIVRCA